MTALIAPMDTDSYSGHCRWMSTCMLKKQAVPDPRDLLGFLDLRAHACEASAFVEKREKPTQHLKTQVAKKVYTAAEDDGCISCEVRHRLYFAHRYPFDGSIDDLSS